MGISYKSLLPKSMQPTRWGQFIDAFQNIIDDVVANLVQPIKTRFQYSLMTNDELKDMALKLGHSITTIDGYTATNTYFLKELLTIVKRNTTKTTRGCYQYIYTIFNLIGETYPMFYTLTLGNYLFSVQEDYWTSSAPRVNTYSLDNSPTPYTLDSTLSLDSSQATSNVPMRHYLLSYYNQFIEDSTQFLSTSSLKAMYNDVKAIKRITEVPYYEPKIKIDLYSGQVGQVTNTTLTDYNLVSYSGVNSIHNSVLFKTNLSGITSIQLGNSGYVNPLVASGGVQSLKYTIANSGGVQTIVDAYTSSKFHVRKIVTERFKFQDVSSGQLYFTELALMNTSGQCIAYSKFPKIQWDPFMYQNIALNVTVI